MKPTIRVVLLTLVAIGPLACARYEWVSDDQTPACRNAQRPKTGRTFTIGQRPDVDSGSFSGRVIHSGDQRPVPGASVTLLTNPTRATTTDSLGSFTFAAVPAGDYLLRTRRIGMQSRMDTLHVAPMGGAPLILPLETVALDGPCSGFAAIRVRKPWWKLW